MTVTIEPVEGWYEEEFLVRSGYEWMEVHVATKGSRLKLKINSSFASMAHSWPACGPDVDWRDWLLHTDFDYFMGKMFGNGFMQFSLRRTADSCLDQMNEWLMYDEMDEGRFDELQSEIEEKIDEIQSEFDDPKLQGNLFLDWLAWQDEFRDFYWEMGCMEPRPDLRRFWDDLWIPFIEGVQVQSVDP